METMSQSLRIKEDLYINMFAEKERILRESKGNLDKIKALKQKLALRMMHDEKVKKLETDNSFLQEKLNVSEDERKKEMDSNLNLYSTVKMHMKSARVAPSDASDEEMRRFLSESNCIELLNMLTLVVKRCTT